MHILSELLRNPGPGVSKAISLIALIIFVIGTLGGMGVTLYGFYSSQWPYTLVGILMIIAALMVCFVMNKLDNSQETKRLEDTNIEPKRYFQIQNTV